MLLPTNDAEQCECLLLDRCCPGQHGEQMIRRVRNCDGVVCQARQIGRQRDHDGLAGWGAPGGIAEMETAAGTWTPRAASVQSWL